nr:hypothetical protein [uncultured Rhodopila sp.]
MKLYVPALLGGVLLAFGLPHPSLAGQVQAVFDPSAAGLAGSTFSADALTGGEVSKITNGPTQQDGSFSWQEIGYLNISGTILNGSAAVPVGLGSTYSLYLAFTINGIQPSLVSPGQATSGTLDLLASTARPHSALTGPTMRR